MEVHELPYYSQFQCTMGDCPNTCCHGWQIVFDEETREKYRKEPGLTGIRLRSGVTKRNGMTMFRHHRGKCPFLTKERTCGVQLSLGEDYMPNVCRIFPRERVNYGAFAEEILILGCPEAARLFLHNLGRLRYETTERQVEYACLGTNEDSDFLHELLGIRDALTAQIANTNIPRTKLYTGLIAYANELQQYYIRKSAAFPVNRTSSSLCLDRAENTEPRLPELCRCIDNAKPYFRITAKMTDEMMTGGFYHILLKKTSPFLHRLCRMYFKEFDQLTGEEAGARADELRAELSGALPETESILRGHLTYYLLQEFLTTYESYSFLRVVATGILHTHFLELLLALYYKNTHSLTEDELIQIISVYDRRGRHCTEIETGMYAVIAPVLPGYTGK